MRSIIAILILFATIILSCKKVTNVQFTSINTGTLSYKLIDDSGKGLPGIRISLYDNLTNVSGSYYDTSKFIKSMVTNQDGVAVFEDMKPEIYLAIADSVTIDKLKYTSREFVQVVASVNKLKEAKVSSVTGNLTITVRSKRDNSTLLTNIGVAAIPFPVYTDPNLLRQIINAAPIKSISNANGVVTLKLPANMPYYILLYTLDMGVIAAYTENITLSQGENRLMQLTTYGNNNGT